MMGVRRWRVVLALGLAFALGAPLAAHADFFGKWYADDSSHDFYYSQAVLGSARYLGVDNARRYSLEPTDMVTSKLAAYSFSVDVSVVLAPGTGDQTKYYAWTYCRYTAGLDRCSQSILTFSSLNSHPDYWALACHEIGHTVGLLENEQSVYGPNSQSAFADRSCMRSSPDHDYFSTHDKGHINAKY